jgi:hypothetical protein
MDGTREKRAAILEERQIVRIHSRAVLGVALALWNRRQKERGTWNQNENQRSRETSGQRSEVRREMRHKWEQRGG